MAPKQTKIEKDDIVHQMVRLREIDNKWIWIIASDKQLSINHMDIHETHELQNNHYAKIDIITQCKAKSTH